ncbi:MAG: DUF5317 domain-containing protein [Anaerolineae bacterium]|nr:DUF5317 domain-containing protein [Anaerolineae bacterium]
MPAAFIPQVLSFFLPLTRTRIPDSAVALSLIVSQLMLLAFVWLNRKQRGFWALGLGLALNFLVIAANGGWMPISPQTLLRLHPEMHLDNWTIGERLGASKDIVLPFSSMALPMLADRIVFPPFFSRGLAYSLGDMFIALGAFLLLFSVGDPSLLGEDEVKV